MKKVWFVTAFGILIGGIVVAVGVSLYQRHESEVEIREDIQHHKLESGAYSLLAAFQMLGVKATIGEVFDLIRYATSGDVMERLLQVTKQKYVHCERVKLTVDELKSRRKPVIVKIKDGQFVLIDEFINGQLQIVNSSDPPYLISKGEFEQIWDGEVLILEPLAPEPKAPHIRFDNARHNFGMLRPGQKVSHTFLFRNDGESPLIVSSVKSSCGCIAVLTSKREINPGDVGKIEVTYTSPGGGGRKTTKQIEVCSNDPYYPVTVLTITSITKQVPKSIPASLLFRYGGREAKLKKQIAITIPPGSKKLQVTRIETSSPQIQAKVISDGKTDSQVKISVSVKPDGKLHFTEKLTIHTDHPDVSKIEVPILCEKLESVMVSPSSLLFGMIPTDEALSRHVLISAKGVSKFRIVNVSVKSPYLSTKLITLKEGQEYELKVTVEKNAPKGPLRDKILLKTDISNQPEIS
ncbi:TPA: DUF1573 domain-containing protein, partial [Candidatus Bathyarchaeota archaeon]|nr:DUF1573 domain-containing protein [Candidatus Bathyarchaeota archaeon]